MELWVRSQDEKELRKARKAVFIESVDELILSTGKTIETGKYSVFIDGHLMGEYKDIERAKEVMADLQHLLSVNSVNSYSYNMPKE